jgi:hypothetical protein
MADDIETQDTFDEGDGSDNLWDIIEREDPENERYADEEEEQDEVTAKQDKLERKITAKMENMTKKFEHSMLRDKVEKFQKEADEIERDLFKTVAADVKTIEDFDKAVAVAKKQAKQLRDTADAYKKQLEEKAEQEAASAWGMGPVGAPRQSKPPDGEQEVLDRIRNNEPGAAFESIVGGDLPPYKR